MTTDDTREEVPQPGAAQQHELEEILREIQGRVYGIALRITRNPADAEDVMQESLLKAYQNLPQFRGESTLASWLGRIVTNQALDILRRKFSRNEIPIDHGSGEEGEGLGAVLPYPGDSPETDVIKSELRAMLAQAIEELDEKLRVVYVMREMGEFSMEELADILELSVPAAKARLFEARKRLEKQLRRQAGNP